MLSELLCLLMLLTGGCLYFPCMDMFSLMLGNTSVMQTSQGDPSMHLHCTRN